MPNKHHGTSLDSFLKEEGVLQHMQDTVLAAVHDTAKGLHKAGAMDQATLGEFNRLSEPAAEAPATRNCQTWDRLTRSRAPAEFTMESWLSTCYQGADGSSAQGDIA